MRAAGWTATLIMGGGFTSKNSRKAQALPRLGTVNSRRPIMQRAKAEIKVVMAVAVACLLVTSSQAASKAEQQEAITKMAEQSLEQLYQAKPAAKAAVEKAAGYAVFSDMGVKILFGGSGKGQGVVVNNHTGQKTYMKMVELQAGLGFGVEKFRNIFVFETESAMNSFIKRAGSLEASRRPQR